MARQKEVSFLFLPARSLPDVEVARLAPRSYFQKFDKILNHTLSIKVSVPLFSKTSRWKVRSMLPSFQVSKSLAGRQKWMNCKYSSGHLLDVSPIHNMSSTRRPKRGPQFAIMQRLLTSLTDHPSAWAFTAPVNGEDVTDYYKVITRPMGSSFSSYIKPAD